MFALEAFRLCRIETWMWRRLENMLVGHCSLACIVLPRNCLPLLLSKTTSGFIWLSQQRHLLTYTKGFTISLAILRFSLLNFSECVLIFLHCEMFWVISIRSQLKQFHKYFEPGSSLHFYSTADKPVITEEIPPSLLTTLPLLP